jgi:hypothetical protein
MIDLDAARSLDAQDELAAYRAAFVYAGDDVIYMDGLDACRVRRSSECTLLSSRSGAAT